MRVLEILVLVFVGGLRLGVASASDCYVPRLFL